MPYVVKSGLDVNVGIDMSGSISQSEYDAFMSEIVGITNGFPQINMTIIPWASEVEEKDIRSFSRADLDEVKNWRSTLTGGTDLSCFTEYMESHPTAFSTFNPTSVNIILTDGFVEEDPKLPARNTLVVLTNPANKSIFEKKNCEVIVMDDIN